MRALHFGAGNIGRGFIGKVLSESGFSVIFSDANQGIVDIINHNKEYSIKIVGKNDNIVNIKNISAIHCNDPKIIKIISEVDLITTAAGPSALDKIAFIIVQGIMLKIKNGSIQPLNIISCENKIQASSTLKRFVRKKLCAKNLYYFKKYIGFVDCSIDTIIPTIKKNQNQNDLFLIAEEFNEWIVNSTQFKGKIPKIIDMKLSRNLNPFIERKFLTLNTGHAIAAYLGIMKKYQTIYDAILDEEISTIVRLAMEESGQVLIKKYNFDKKNHYNYIDKIFLRFKNPFLEDNLERIARNPMQKLGREERLITPLLGSIKYELPYTNLAKGVAAALHYKNKNDLESRKIASLVKQQGIKKTLVKICHLSENSKEVDSIFFEYTTLLKKYIKLEH